MKKSIETRHKMSIARKKWYKNNPKKAKDKAKKCGITKIKNGTHKGDKNGRWKGGKGSYYRSKARLIMEEYLQRKLKSNEIVHHFDNDITNNSLQNLMIMDKINHTRLHNFQRLLKGGK